ncbi:hypothetical protein ABT255_42330 [Streptomyces mirabilis]|uniref:hypothetical protein n=1 Tax=Streptomyces mirabilis TaxID=68239 RepID=UPI0033349D9F
MAAPPVIARTARYFHTRVGRTELDKLFLVAAEGAPAGTVSVRCTVGNAHLQEDTLDDLIAARAALPYVSNRTPWTALTFERDEGAARYIGIEFKDGLVTVTVRSGEPIWTHGQAHRLGEILREAHGATAPRPYKRQLGQTAGMLITLVTLWILNAQTPGFSHDPLYVFMQGLLAATGALGFASLIRVWLRLRSSRAVLNVTADVQWGSAWSRLSSGDRIAVVSAVIGGLTLIATAAAALV